MKRYKLVKDLPTFSAGEEFYLDRNGDLVYEERLPENLKCLPHRIVAYSKSTLEKFPNILKDWFEELPERPKSVWDLEEDDTIWMVDSKCDEVYQTIWLDYYNSERSCGDVYLTKEEAEKELAWRKARQILKQDTKGFKPNWRSGEYNKYEVAYEYSDGEYDGSGLFVNDCNHCCSHNDLWFASIEDAEASIRAHANEWKIYLGVEE